MNYPWLLLAFVMSSGGMCPVAQGFSPARVASSPEGLRYGHASQAASTLHIRVALAGADQAGRPVVRHALLISDSPVTAAPRRVVTGTDGTVDVRLRPGTYIVESDQPAVFQGKSYQWTQAVTIVAGRDATLELNAGNAEIGAAAAAGPEQPDLESLFEQWEGSVVTVWSDTAYGSGFLIDARGLIATNQRVVGRSESAEVELTPVLKIAARVLASNAEKNVAILWVDPAAVASIKPVRLGLAEGAPLAGTRGSPYGLTTGQQIFGVGSPLRGRKYMTTGTVSRVGARAIESDLTVDPGNAGGPVFGPDGQVVGIATLGPAREEGPPIAGVIRIDQAREVLAQAESKMRTGEAPKGTPLPIEPARAYSEDALKAAVKGRMPNAIDYELKAADFDVNFITPVLTYSLVDRAQRADPHAGAARSLDTFENWAEYVSEYPPVVMIRATPKLVEGFWSVVGRQAAQTQGIQLPPGTKHPKAGFVSMRVYCGDKEVTPIHPFKIAHRLEMRSSAGNADDIAYEGLYVFDPNALGPQCGTVKLVLFSEKDPAKGDTRMVDAKLIDRIWQDFAAYR